ncbi:MAG: hydrogen peroxide-inducible genes activator [Ahrensia sp.]|nr:hydrogen peroxide-inducible genes activator [Ahrensia sp.]
MNNITLRQLRYFNALAEHQHFGRAALACSISQPALSMQIKELEETLGQILFERHAKQLQLTEFGKSLLGRTQEIARSIDEISDMARAAKNSITGKLRIGIIPTIAPYMLPSIIETLTNAYSGIDIHVRETLTPNLIQELNDGKLDTAILALPISETWATEVTLFKEDFVLIRHANDKEKPIPDGEKLQKMRLLLLEEGHCFRDQALSFCNMRPGVPRDGLDGSSLSTLVQMVGAGIGVTLIPQMAVDVETRAANVSIGHFPNPKPSRTIGMVWRKSSPLATQLIEISQVIRQAVSDQV